MTRGLTIVVNMHHYDEMALDPAAHQGRSPGGEDICSFSNALYRIAKSAPAVTVPVAVKAGINLWSQINNEPAGLLRLYRPCQSNRFIQIKTAIMESRSFHPASGSESTR